MSHPPSSPHLPYAEPSERTHRFQLDIQKVGEYTITAVGQDHTKYQIKSVPPAKLIRRPGAAEHFECKWSGDSQSPTVELGALPTIIVSFYDSDHNAVNPEDVQPTITVSSTIALRVPQPKHRVVDRVLHIDPVLELEHPDRERLTCVSNASLDVQVTLSNGSRKQAGQLALSVGTGAPKELVIEKLEDLKAKLTSPISRTDGFPAFEIALRDDKRRNCVFDQGKAPVVHIINTTDGTLLTKLELRDDGTLSTNHGEVPTSKLLFGQTNVKLHAQLFDRASRDPQPIKKKGGGDTVQCPKCGHTRFATEPRCEACAP